MIVATIMLASAEWDREKSPCEGCERVDWHGTRADGSRYSVAHWIRRFSDGDTLTAFLAACPVNFGYPAAVIGLPQPYYPPCVTHTIMIFDAYPVD